ncbi:MAG TPA: hypothetical protein VK638_53115 [Edaphobacter sp.]|nr:hypothetical protein [Edaphobacter sp.]
MKACFRWQTAGRLREDHVFIEWYEEPSGPHRRTIVTPEGEKLVLFKKDTIEL